MDVWKKAWNEIAMEDEQISKMMANSDVPLVRFIGKVMSYCNIYFYLFCLFLYGSVGAVILLK